MPVPSLFAGTEVTGEAAEADLNDAGAGRVGEPALGTDLETAGVGEDDVGIGVGEVAEIGTGVDNVGMGRVGEAAVGTGNDKAEIGEAVVGIGVDEVGDVDISVDGVAGEAMISMGVNAAGMEETAGMEEVAGMAEVTALEEVAGVEEVAGLEEVAGVDEVAGMEEVSGMISGETMMGEAVGDVAEASREVVVGMPGRSVEDRAVGIGVVVELELRWAATVLLWLGMFSSPVVSILLQRQCSMLVS